MRIRFADRFDIPDLVKHGREFWNGTRYGKVDNRPYNAESVRVLIEGLVGDKNILVAVDRDETVAGFVLVTQYPLAWDFDIKVCGELAWYVAPEHRGTSLGVALLQQAEELAKLRGCQYMAMISMSHSMDVGPLYEKLGYIETEVTYTKEL